MKPGSSLSDDELRAAAAKWAVRRDRGLSASEAIEFELWLAADERHAAAMRQMGAAWTLLDRIPEQVAVPVLSAARRRRTRSRWMATTAALAACLVLGGWLLLRPASDTSPAALAAVPPRVLTLADGTLVHLNTGAQLHEHFTRGERRVALTHGEAHFAVTHDPSRPFVVEAGAFHVRAVGTAFNVARHSSRIEVLVTEGRVQLTSAGETRGPDSPPLPLLEAGQQAVLGSTPGAKPIVRVTSVSSAQIAQALAWQEPLLRLGGASLAEIIAEFQRRTGGRVILAEPSLASLRVGGRIRVDDAEAFTSVLGAALDLEHERLPDGALLLRRKSSQAP